MPRSRIVSAAVVLLFTRGLVACSGWDPWHPFERDAPEVNQAIREFDAGEAGVAAQILEEYLGTGGCKEGSIGAPRRLGTHPNGAFDLGLSLFGLAEKVGGRFGQEESAPAQDEMAKGLRAGDIECALKIVRVIGADEAQPVDLRARARYLEGNLLFLDKKYKEAVEAYDKALALEPGQRGDAGDPVGRDAAWNRAIALRRIEDQKDASPPDSGPPPPDASPPPDGGPPPPDGGGSPEGGKNDGDGGGQGGNDGGSKDPDPKDGGDPSKPPPPSDGDGGAAPPPPPSRKNQDERILDQLENAPTLQQEAAKKQAEKRRAVRGMADK